jgi:hypothetical protein
MSESETKTDLVNNPGIFEDTAVSAESVLPDCTSPSMNILMGAFMALGRDGQPSAEMAKLFEDIHMTVHQADEDSDPVLTFETARMEEDNTLYTLPDLAKPLDSFMGRLAACAEGIEGIAVEGRSIHFDHSYSLLELIHAYIAEHNIVTWDTLEMMGGVQPPDVEDDLNTEGAEVETGRMDNSALENMMPANPAEIFYHLAKNGADINRLPEDGTVHEYMLYHLPGRPYSGKADIDAMTSRMTKLFNGSAGRNTCSISLEHIEATIHDEETDNEVNASPPPSLCNPYYRLH